MKKEVIINLGNTRGVSRKIDELGRIVLPIEYRKELDLKVRDSVEIFLLEDGIYIKKN